MARRLSNTPPLHCCCGRARSAVPGPAFRRRCSAVNNSSRWAQARRPDRRGCGQRWGRALFRNSVDQLPTISPEKCCLLSKGVHRMRTWQATYLATIIFAQFSCSAIAGNIHGDVYFRDGIDNQDGMNSFINYPGRTMRVLGERNALSNCGDNPPGRMCVNSVYFNFYMPTTPAQHWESDGVEFMVAGQCRPSAGAENASAYVVRSQQAGKTLTFYVAQPEGLLGWEIAYDDDRYRYLKEGMRLQSCDEIPDSAPAKR